MDALTERLLADLALGPLGENAVTRAEPRRPAHVKKATIRRDWRGVRYEIRVENRRNDGAVRLEIVSGKATVEGTLVRAARGEKKVVLRAVAG